MSYFAEETERSKMLFINYCSLKIQLTLNHRMT